MPETSSFFNLREFEEGAGCDVFETKSKKVLSQALAIFCNREIKVVVRVADPTLGFTQELGLTIKF